MRWGRRAACKRLALSHAAAVLHLVAKSFSEGGVEGFAKGFANGLSERLNRITVGPEKEGRREGGH